MRVSLVYLESTIQEGVMHWRKSVRRIWTLDSTVRGDELPKRVLRAQNWAWG